MSQRKTGNWVLCLILIALGITLVIGVGRWMAGREGDGGRVASMELVSHFNVALASLDVDESERALAALDSAIALASDEPALWANKAISRARLNQQGLAAEALEKAQAFGRKSRGAADTSVAERCQRLHQASRVDAYPAFPGKLLV